MKKLLVAIAAMLVAAATYGQGAVSFNTHVLGSVEAPVTLATDNATGAGTIPGLTAALFTVSGDTFTMVPGSTTTFRTGAAAKYVQPIDVIFAGNTGQPVDLVMRVWSGADFDSAKQTGTFGESAVFTVTPLAPPNAPANLTTLNAFTVTTVPEPTTIALGVLGLGALLIRRRK